MSKFNNKLQCWVPKFIIKRKAAKFTYYAWGKGSFGQLGNGTNTAAQYSPIPIDTSGYLKGKIITSFTSADHLLLLTSDNLLFSSGKNDHGQAGTNGEPNTNTAYPVDMTNFGNKKIVKIGVGDDFSVALTYDGYLFLWGSDSRGQQGNGASLGDILIPTALGSGYKDFGVGYTHVIAQLTDGSLRGWGSGLKGELGNGAYLDSDIPVPVVMTGVLNGKTIIQITAGLEYSAVLLSDGTVATWGFNDAGTLANGTNINSNVPVLVDTTGNLSGEFVTQISAGTNHLLVKTNSNRLLASGSNFYGEIGNNAPTGVSSPTFNTVQPVDQTGVLAGETIITMAAGENTSLVITKDKIAMFGDGSSGQLGNDGATLPISAVPVEASVTPADYGKRSAGVTTIGEVFHGCCTIS